MVSEIGIDEVGDALERCAGDVLWEAGVVAPPVDAFVIANRLGLVVAQDQCARYRGRFVRLAGATRGAIVLGEEDRPERRHWAVAHEIGEFFAHRVFHLLGVSPTDAEAGTREAVANQLAGRLLLPGTWLQRAGSTCGWDLWELKGHFATASHELIARRMLEMPPPVAITVFDHGRLSWRQSNVSMGVGRLHEVERKVWQTVHDTALPCRATPQAEIGLQLVTGWPVNEPGWRREILRTEFCELAQTA